MLFCGGREGGKPSSILITQQCIIVRINSVHIQRNGSIRPFLAIILTPIIRTVKRVRVVMLLGVDKSGLEWTDHFQRWRVGNIARIALAVTRNLLEPFSERFWERRRRDEVSVHSVGDSVHRVYSATVHSVIYSVGRVAYSVYSVGRVVYSVYSAIDSVRRVGESSARIANMAVAGMLAVLRRNGHNRSLKVAGKAGKNLRARMRALVGQNTRFLSCEGRKPRGWGLFEGV